MDVFAGFFLVSMNIPHHLSCSMHGLPCLGCSGPHPPKLLNAWLAVLGLLWPPPTLVAQCMACRAWAALAPTHLSSQCMACRALGSSGPSSC
ncbi:hypothetical protein BC832DRAFT_476279 [Gaertneriomyces semiglobifer]|nr:hypothetical protein BC832DRAFT_476279 [Gaertneriomyces semiglobifer]